MSKFPYLGQFPQGKRLQSPHFIQRPDHPGTGAAPRNLLTQRFAPCARPRFARGTSKEGNNLPAVNGIDPEALSVSIGKIAPSFIDHNVDGEDIDLEASMKML